jgi:D-alanyl-lipoteichoic acid acyltransferase DltB (MBOAT superfamily)
VVTGSGKHLLIGIAIAAIFAVVLSVFSALQQARYLCIVCVVGAAAFYWDEFAGFAVVNGLAYAALRWLDRQNDRAVRWRWACLMLVLLIIIFTLGRALQFEHWMTLPGPVPVVLYSLDMWLVLRLITLFWEVGSGSVAAPPVVTFIVWTCLPLTLGGPILRYSQFPLAPCPDRSLWKSSNWWIDVAAGAAKLVAGLGLTAAQAVMVTRWPSARLLKNVVIAFFTGPVGFYLTTAGYLDLMQALGKPSGTTLATSFNFPFGRENISQFWANWNMTATAVFRDYIFYNRWGVKTYNVYFNAIVLFLLVGLWHAANAYWILWGFLHGLLFCSFMAWRKLGDRFTHIPLRHTTSARCAARIATYVAVCLCWYLPSKILQKLGMA